MKLPNLRGWQPSDAEFSGASVVPNGAREGGVTDELKGVGKLSDLLWASTEWLRLVSEGLWGLDSGKVLEPKA